MKSDYHHISVDIHDHVARIVLNKAPVNALDRSLVDELTGLARMLRSEPSVWVVCVSSALRVFSAGADLKERAGLSSTLVTATVRRIQKMVRAWYTLPQPVVMVIQGAALGGGFEFALTGDILCASEDAVIGLPETRLGIIPAAGGTRLLQWRTSSAVASRWILPGGRHSGTEAHRDGVVDFVFPAERFPDELERLIQSLASSAPLALRQAKKAIRSAHSAALTEGFRTEITCYASLIRSHDRAEALKAFLEKREPHFLGT